MYLCKEAKTGVRQSLSASLKWDKKQNRLGPNNFDWHSPSYKQAISCYYALVLHPTPPRHSKRGVLFFNFVYLVLPRTFQKILEPYLGHFKTLVCVANHFTASVVDNNESTGLARLSITHSVYLRVFGYFAFVPCFKLANGFHLKTDIIQFGTL